MSITALPPYPNHPLIIQQGNSWCARFVFGHGKISQIKTTSPGAAPTVVTRTPHCLNVGDWVHLATPDDCCQLVHGTYEVTATPDDTTATLAHQCGQESISAVDGWITRALDLRGFSVKGAIATKNPRSASPPNLVGSIAAGDDSILIVGEVDVSQRDTIYFPGAGIDGAIVTGVYTADIDGETYSVITLDQQATTTVPMDTPAKFRRFGGVLGSFDFTVDPDPRCGTAVAKLDHLAFSDLSVPGSCCDGLFEIGCYQIVLCQGQLAPRESYPKESYVSWASTFSSGPVYLRSGFV